MISIDSMNELVFVLVDFSFGHLFCLSIVISNGIVSLVFLVLMMIVDVSFAEENIDQLKFKKNSSFIESITGDRERFLPESFPLGVIRK